METKPSLLMRLIGLFFRFKPLVFAFGILMPLVAQILIAATVRMPEGLSPYWVGFVVAALWGGFAQWKGRWI